MPEMAVFWNAIGSIAVTPSGITTLASCLQLAKAEVGTEATLAGNEKDSRPELAKTAEPRSVGRVLKLTVLRAEQYSK